MENINFASNGVVSKRVMKISPRSFRLEKNSTNDDFSYEFPLNHHREKKQICNFFCLYFFFLQNLLIENNFEKHFIGSNSNHSSCSKYKFAPAASQIWFAENSTRL